MGKRLKERAVHPDVMLSSPAKRALSTCKRIADVLGFNKENIVTDRDLYHADEDEILAVVRKIKDVHDTVLIFGHNPGLTDFVNLIMPKEETQIGNVPTCGVVAFSFDVPSWNRIESGSGQFLFFDFPKSKDD